MLLAWPVGTYNLPGKDSKGGLSIECIPAPSIRGLGIRYTEDQLV